MIKLSGGKITIREKLNGTVANTVSYENGEISDRYDKNNKWANNTLKSGRGGFYPRIDTEGIEHYKISLDGISESDMTKISSINEGDLVDFTECNEGRGKQYRFLEVSSDNPLIIICTRL